MKLYNQFLLLAIAWVALFGVPDMPTDWDIPGWIVASDAPIKEPGFRVYIVEESGERDKLTPGQKDVILSNAPGSVREYAKTHVVKTGDAPEFRVLDKDTNVSLDSPGVQQAMALPRTSLPWIVVSNGPSKGGQSIPLPPTAAETLALLKKYGGE